MPRQAVPQLGSLVAPQGARGGAGRHARLGSFSLPLVSPPWTMYDAGKEKGSIFDALEDLDYQACVDRCVAISKA